MFIVSSRLRNFNSSFRSENIKVFSFILRLSIQYAEYFDSELHQFERLPSLSIEQTPSRSFCNRRFRGIVSLPLAFLGTGRSINDTELFVGSYYGNENYQDHDRFSLFWMFYENRSIDLFRSDGTWPIFFFFYLILTFRGRIIDEPFTENKEYRRGESLNRMLVSLISVASCKTVEGER